MTIAYQTLRNWQFQPIEYHSQARDVILYSLDIGWRMLNFWVRHGLAATMDAFAVSGRTLSGTDKRVGY